MLLELSIQRIALIEHVQLRLQPGFNVFTGETGAGKSILLDSLGLLLGNRASADLIRSGAETGYVEALFTLESPVETNVRDCLAEWGMDDAGNELIVSREIHRNGRNVCRINGRMVTVQQLKDLGQYLVQQHGQHDHQGLLRPDEQLQALDLYARHLDLVHEVRSLHQSWTDAIRVRDGSRLDEQERIRRLDMLSFQIEEIEHVQLQPGEAEELREKRRRLQHADKIAGAVNNALAALEGSESKTGVLGLLGKAYDEVSVASTYEPGVQDTLTMIETSQVNADEATRALYRLLDGFDTNPGELEHIESRLADIRYLERKYGQSVDDVLSFLEQARAERTALNRHEEQLSGLEEAVVRSEAALRNASETLHQSRLKAAEQMSVQVAGVLRQLSMPHAMFQVLVQVRSGDNGSHGYTPSGIDAVQYLFTANKGEEPKTFQKIASGGELSRMLLSMKTVLADVDELGTLIFDEIDTGVSGTAVQAIADLMSRLARHRQVLCVTHSAQIAASAGTHFSIRKDEHASQTQTVVHLLDDAGRIREVARLLGSGVSDETAVQHAAALLQRSAGD